MGSLSSKQPVTGGKDTWATLDMGWIPQRQERRHPLLSGVSVVSYISLARGHVTFRSLSQQLSSHLVPNSSPEEEV